MSFADGEHRGTCQGLGLPFSLKAIYPCINYKQLTFVACIINILRSSSSSARVTLSPSLLRRQPEPIACPGGIGQPFARMSGRGQPALIGWASKRAARVDAASEEASPDSARFTGGCGGCWARSGPADSSAKAPRKEAEERDRERKGG